MLVALPLLCWLVWTLVHFAANRDDADHAPSRRQACVVALILCGAWTVAGTELLSLIEGIDFWPLAAWWGVPLAFGVALLIRCRRSLIEKWPAPVKTDWADSALIGLIVAFLVMPGLAATFAPPNNWDSMTYHLPRQIYWIQNHSVHHYPPNSPYQLTHPPFAEFVGLQLMVLSGGDRFANLVQWFGLAMTTLLASLIARDLGCGRKGQLLAAALVVLTPTAYIWASNTKNDLVVAVWACAAAWWAIHLLLQRQCTLGRAALIGTTVGLLVLTKGTAYFFGAASGLLIAGATIRARRWQFWQPALVMAVCALAVNSGHWTRNYLCFGSLLGPSDQHFFGNTELTPAGLVSQVVRNTALHLALPWDAWNQELYAQIAALHNWLGLGISDSRTTIRPFTVSYTPQHEDMTPAPAHVFLTLLLAPLAFLMYRRLPRPGLTIVYLAIPISGFLLFCFLLKWMPWHARLHIPVLCLLAPFLALMMTRRPIAHAVPLLVAGIVLALWPTLRDNYRPVFGGMNVFRRDRLLQRFHRWPGLQEPTQQLAALVARLNIDEVGLKFGSDDWEYAAQRLILDHARRPIRFVPFRSDVLPGHPNQFNSPALMIHNSRHAGQRFDAPGWSIAADKKTGASYTVMAQFPPYTVYCRNDVSAGVHADPLSLRFLGWRRCQGFDELEGPFPKLHLPVGRWATGPQMTLEVDRPTKETIFLIADWRRNSRPDLEVTIMVNGKQVHKHQFASVNFDHLCLRLSLEAGPNTIVFCCDDYEKNSTRRETVFFKRLLLVPEDQIESWPPAAQQELLVNFETDFSRNP